MKAFCRALYEHRPFLGDFEPFAAEVARAGDRAALGQLLLKLTVPGVPDVYQGDELLALSLVDPDNRRPVDWERRRELLAEVRRGAAPTAETLKMWLIVRALTLRAHRPDAFARRVYAASRPGRTPARSCAGDVGAGRDRAAGRSAGRGDRRPGGDVARRAGRRRAAAVGPRAARGAARRDRRGAARAHRRLSRRHARARRAPTRGRNTRTENCSRPGESPPLAGGAGPTGPRTGREGTPGNAACLLARRRVLRSRSGSLAGRRARADPLLGVPADRRRRPRAARAQAVRGARGGRRAGGRRHARRRAAVGDRGPPRRRRAPRARARLPQGRPRRVHRLGRAHERRHARRGARARRAVRPRALARLAGRRRGARARAALRRPVAGDRARDRVRPPPGLGRQAPPVAHPRGREADGARRRPRDHLLGVHARPGRRRVRRAGAARDRDPERDRPDRPAAGRGPPAPARAVRRARREARAAGRPAGLREGLPPRARRDAAG